MVLLNCGNYYLNMPNSYTKDYYHSVLQKQHRSSLNNWSMLMDASLDKQGKYKRLPEHMQHYSKYLKNCYSTEL